MHYIRFLCVACVAVVLALPAMAQSNAPSADALAAAKDLVETTGALKQFEAMVPLTVAQVTKGITVADPAYLTDNKQKEALDAASKIATTEGEKLKEQLNQDVVRLYATRFTIAELKEVNAFMKSGSGQKFVSQAPGILQDSVRLGQYWNAEMASKLAVLMRDELAKRGVK